MFAFNEQIGDLTIKFPFQIYPQQKEFMNDIIQCLQNNQNGLFDAPTGNIINIQHQQKQSGMGKSLCFMASCLSFIRNEQKNRQIIYATRTSCQIDSLLLQLSKIKSLYPNIKWSVQASKEKFCINKEVKDMSQGNANLLKQYCNKSRPSRYKKMEQKMKIQEEQNDLIDFNNQSNDKMIEDNKIKYQQQQQVQTVQCSPCPYYKDVEKDQFFDFDFDEIQTNKNSQNLKDLEDLKQIYHENTNCPFYIEKHLSKLQSEIIFITYNYLFDNQIFPQFHKTVNNTSPIIIIDEGHNIEATISDCQEIKLKIQWIDSIIQFLNDFKEDLDKFRGQIELQDKKEKEDNYKQLENLKQYIEPLKQYFNQVINQIKSNFADKIDKDANKHILFCHDQKHSQMIKIFASQLLTFPFYNENKKNKEKISIHQILFKYSKASTIFSQINYSLTYKNYFQKYSDFISGLQNLNMDQTIDNQLNSNFLMVEKYEKIKQNQTKYKINLSITPIVSQLPFKRLLEFFNPQSILVASGTMKPFEVFQMLGINFQTFQYSHVIDSKKQLLVKLISYIDEKSKNNKQTTDFSYSQQKNSKNQNYYNWHQQMEATFQGIIKLTENLRKGGTLIFFPSYSQLKDFKQFLERDSQEYKKFCENNPQNIQVYYDLQNAKYFNEQFKNYKSVILDKQQKAIYFSVVQGKLAEGIDFIGDLARMILIIGLPFHNLKDPLIKGKIHYLNKINDEEEFIINGHQWYLIQCAKRINQTLGRGIRDSQDYCSMFIIDDRINYECISYGLVKYLSKWVQDGGFGGPFIDKKKHSLNDILKLQNQFQQQNVWKNKNDCCICLDNSGYMYSTVCCQQPMHLDCYKDLIQKQQNKCPLCKSQQFEISNQIQNEERMYNK